MIHPDEPLLDADEIQGNSLRGFDTNHQELLAFRIDDLGAARTWLAALGDRLASLAYVHDYRLRRSEGDANAQREALLNAALSRFGLEMLGFDPAQVGDGFFNAGMGSLAGSLGDQVADYVVGQDREHTPDVVLLLGCHDAGAMESASQVLQAEAAAAGLRLIHRDRGSLLPGEVEHFGFRDGISQVGPRGLLPGDPPHPLTLRLVDPADPQAEWFAQPGRPLVWPGQFVFGYRTQMESSQEPGEVLLPAPWMKNGSLLVFRRLKQDVEEFRSFLSAAAKQLTEVTGAKVTEEQVGSRVVGRWKDGSPVTLSGSAPSPQIAADPFHVNHIAYGGTGEIAVVDPHTHASRIVPGHPEDAAGQVCPRFAHIRKVNPRNLRTDQGRAEKTLTFQMLRRGIPYGPAFSEAERTEERGLLFLAYMTSFKRQFHILNKLWMNNPEAPEGEPGHDLLVGQVKAGQERYGIVRDSAGTPLARLRTQARFVIPTGGAFLFSPSKNFFSLLVE